MKKYIILSLIGYLAASCSSVPVTGRKQLNLVSDQEVLASSLQQYDTYIKAAPLSADKAKTEMVVRAGKRISAAVEQYLKDNGMADQIQNYKWEFHLVKDDAPNAFCMPGGKIVVYEGILPYTGDEAGLAVVMGHEVAHAVAKHSNERMSQSMVTQTGGALLDSYLGSKSEMTHKVGMEVFGLGAQYGVMLPFSRKHEYEADKMGLMFMAMAGYDPNTAAAFWERMSQSSGGQAPPQFMSTHPSDASRIAEIKKELPNALKYYKVTAAPVKPAKAASAKPAAAKPATVKPAGKTDKQWSF